MIESREIRSEDQRAPAAESWRSVRTAFAVDHDVWDHLLAEVARPVDVNERQFPDKRDVNILLRDVGLIRRFEVLQQRSGLSVTEMVRDAFRLYEAALTAEIEGKRPTLEVRLDGQPGDDPSGGARRAIFAEVTRAEGAHE